MILTIIIIVLFIALFYTIYLYNEIIRRKNQTANAFGSIDAMLKKRYDLIPNLVELVKGYMSYEQNILSELTRLRSGYEKSQSANEKVDLHNDISRKINGIFMLVENYPDLKANRNFLKLQGSLNETEEQIAAARRFYNSSVTLYNDAIQTFPSNIIANIFTFEPMKVFEIHETERIIKKETF
jgi:LemA protein